jgi:SWIB/MDM2 domain
MNTSIEQTNQMETTQVDSNLVEANHNETQTPTKTRLVKISAAQSATMKAAAQELLSTFTHHLPPNMRRSFALNVKKCALTGVRRERRLGTAAPNTGFNVLKQLTDEACAIMNLEPGTRETWAQMTKFVNQHIKQYKLQVDGNTSLIELDDFMKALLGFGKTQESIRIRFTEMQSLLKRVFVPKVEVNKNVN